MDPGIPTPVAPTALTARSTSDAPAARFGDGTQRGGVPPVLFFDGVCGICNYFIDFVISRDRAAVFRFAPLQGETARERLPETDLRELNTMVLWEEQGIFRKSTAATRILIRLGGFWLLLGTVLRLVPRPLRDAGYSVVARHRYRIFGKKETCRMPTPSERARFLP
ncbi:MAG TPA: DCC1-like thiol-disulfide oxidoreductase family protein [Planctomycetaceae bacterium]|jgi:predicted DCC family thiol-disulfide oxidoreductase YuxK|nr:DCC1-like thiol-disulfide oxidoreductase family protein [Planctomycetaceae bacterium]